MQAEELLKITICKMTIFPPIRRHNINCDSVHTHAGSAFHNLRLLFPLAGSMKRGCHRPVTAKMKQTNKQTKNKTHQPQTRLFIFFGTVNSVKEERQQTDIVGG